MYRIIFQNFIYNSDRPVNIPSGLLLGFMSVEGQHSRFTNKAKTYYFPYTICSVSHKEHPLWDFSEKPPACIPQRHPTQQRCTKWGALLQSGKRLHATSLTLPMVCERQAGKDRPSANKKCQHKQAAGPANPSPVTAILLTVSTYKPNLLDVEDGLKVW